MIDRFHVQKLAYDAVQEVRIQYRWETLDKENEAIEDAKQAGVPYQPEILDNGDTLKQLLVRSRDLLFKHQDKWTASQLQRSKLQIHIGWLSIHQSNLQSEFVTIAKSAAILLD